MKTYQGPMRITDPRSRSISILTLKSISVQFSQWLLIFTLTAAVAFAQNSAFGQAAQGLATEMIAIAKWVGIILCIACGISIFSGGHGAVAKAAGFFVGLIFALFPAQIVSWIQSL